MQVRTPARQPGPRVGLDNVPSRYEAKQAGLNRTLLAAYTGTHRGHTRDMPLGSHGHYDIKSTVSRRSVITGQTRAGGAAEAAAARVKPTKRPDYSGAWAVGPPLDETAGSSAETTASDLMSMRQPVSLAASLAFWPSLPIASDSW
jgi:hypothetical protein